MHTLQPPHPQARIISLVGRDLGVRDETVLDELSRGAAAGVQGLGPKHLDLLVSHSSYV